MSLYVYAITDTSHPLRLEGMKGVGDPPTELRTVTTDGLCAVASEAPEDLRPSRRDLEAHHEVQARLWEQGTILPMGFGLVAADEEAVRTVLDQRAQEFTDRIEALRDHVEFNVKAAWDEDAVLRAILEESEPLRRLNEATRSGNGTYEDRLALGEQLAQEVDRRKQAMATDVVNELESLAEDQRIEPPSSQYAVNASFLVDRSRADEFTEAGEQLAQRLGEDAGIRLLGPLPPYSFV